MEDPTLQSIEWPERRVVYNFDHETAGDAIYRVMVRQAFAELTLADPFASLDHFVASNGVRITITWPPTADNTTKENA